MRTSFVVGIFVLAVAVAGTTEWASRRAASNALGGTTAEQTQKAPDAGAAGPAPFALRGSEGSPGAPSPNGVGSTAGNIKRTLVLGEGQGGFRLNAVTLSDDAISKIDEMFASLDKDWLGAHFVIEGYTDNLGSPDVNQKIGLARALAVRQYLAEQYEIPRDLMRVVSYGSEQPIADNGTQEGRALNRRVVIKVIGE